VVVNEAYDGAFGSSTFDYSNTTSDGLVDNSLILFSANGTSLPVYRNYVNSNFPLFLDDMLVEGGAVFSGLVERLLVGQVASVRPFSKIFEHAYADFGYSGAFCIKAQSQ